MSPQTLAASLAWPAADTALAAHLAAEWQAACSGDPPAQSGWQVGAGGLWTWQPDGVTVQGTGDEWADLRWERFDPNTIRELGNFVVEVTVSGNANAAGLSFGHFKDCLTAIDTRSGPKRLRLEVDLETGGWAFRIDGQLQTRTWWDSGIQSAQDFAAGMLFLKARAAQQVHFQDLTIHTLPASCRLTVIITCHRFLQRLRVTLRNWCHQTLAVGAYEILVVNPGSPDGTHEHLAAVAQAYPHVRLLELPLDTILATNKGAMINRAAKVARGDWIWLTDADCLVPAEQAADTLAKIETRGLRLFYGERRHLPMAQTQALLAGRLDGLADFEQLCREATARPPDQAPWGYTQILPRAALQQVPYREQINHFAHSDSIFIEDCKRRHIYPELVDGLHCLHLDHPFAWYGTHSFL